MAPALAAELLGDGCRQEPVAVLEGVEGEDLNALVPLVGDPTSEDTRGNQSVLLDVEFTGPLRVQGLQVWLLE
eukprot:1946266-Alexandrium_andersonii.AAC.1